MLQDVDVSHIFIACDHVPAADTLRAYSHATNLLKMIKGGATPKRLPHRTSSDDESSKKTAATWAS